MATTQTLGSATTAAGGAQPAPESTREAPPKDVQRWLQAGHCVLIDVREPDEHARERIAGARLLPLSRFDPHQAAAMARPGQRIVFHCRGGRRSADACRMAASLASSGLDVVGMTGGIEAWKQDALPVQVNTHAPGISVMRQVQLVIGLCVLAGSALAWFIDARLVVVPAFFGAGLTFAGASGTCLLASVIGWMPWNRVKGAAACDPASAG